VIAAVAQAGWKGPRILGPLLRLGERSYEVYLTHMFVVFCAFGLFVRAGKPMWAVRGLFVGVIVMAGVLGEVVARFYSEPLNRAIRKRSQGGKRTEVAGIAPIPERADS